jgi:HEAT repeat protein
MSLRHPILDHRLLAIAVLGDLKSECAVPVLEKMLAREDNSLVICEIARALANIGSPQAHELIERVKRHPSSLVRHFLADPSGSATPGAIGMDTA